MYYFFLGGGSGLIFIEVLPLSLSQSLSLCLSVIDFFLFHNVCTCLFSSHPPFNIKANSLFFYFLFFYFSFSLSFFI